MMMCLFKFDTQKGCFGYSTMKPNQPEQPSDIMQFTLQRASFEHESMRELRLCSHAALLGVLGATIVQFNKVSPTASYLLLPYLAWTSYATALTASIYKKNPQVQPQCPLMAT